LQEFWYSILAKKSIATTRFQDGLTIGPSKLKSLLQLSLTLSKYLIFKFSISKREKPENLKFIAFPERKLAKKTGKSS
jgi:hypothetical protein